MVHEIEPKKLDISYRDAAPRPKDMLLFIFDGQILLHQLSDERIAFPTVSEFSGLSITRLLPENEGFTFLFAIDETAYFTFRYDEDKVTLETLAASAEEGGLRFFPIRFLRHSEPNENAFAGLLSGMLYGWYRRSRYCGHCGTRTVHAKNERMVSCPKCGNLIFPQICPGVIVGVKHEGKLLVTRYAPTHLMFDGNGKTYQPVVHDALVAGYIESGETAEQAVMREVFEETGLSVKNIRYYMSAPWPLSSSLLFGYICEVDGDPTVKREESELSSAVFMAPSEIPAITGHDISLTRRMMEDFRCGKF